MTSDPTEFDENDAETAEASPTQVEHAAVIFSTDWTAETLVGQMRKGNIDLSPRFQRRDAWPRARKSRFIESVILGLPIPQIVLAEAPGQKGRFIVLDGKQRLLTLLQFWGDAISSPNNAFKLTSLDFLNELSGTTYKALQENAPQLAALQNASIRTAIVRDWKSEAYLHLVFLRLNTGSLPLSPQELRLALTPGPFSEYVDQQAINDTHIHELLGMEGADPRMRDVELLVRFIALQMFLTNYGGRLRPFLDESYKTLNREWQQLKPTVENLSSEFSLAIRALIKIFGDDVARKKGSRLFNRAIFDALIYYAVNPALRTLMTKRETQVRAEYKKLIQDADFISAVEKDTAGIPNTSLRLRMWGSALERACKVSVKIPQEKDGRLVP